MSDALDDEPYVPGGTTLICEALTAQWGERCPDFEPGCWCCRAWAEFDALMAHKEVDWGGAVGAEFPNNEAAE